MEIFFGEFDFIFFAAFLGVVFGSGRSAGVDRFQLMKLLGDFAPLDLVDAQLAADRFFVDIDIQVVNGSLDRKSVV